MSCTESTPINAAEADISGLSLNCFLFSSLFAALRYQDALCTTLCLSVCLSVCRLHVSL